MKHIFTTLLFLLLIISLVGQTKRALIVAISNYTHWPRLSSINDVDFITRSLSKQGFLKANINTVKDQKATHPGITNALTGLINDSKEGDIVVIHFSSHGEQIEDDNGDETDFLDETVVTYNAVLPDNEGHFKDFQKAQQDYFRDDEFGSLINKLRIKLGRKGDVIVFMDLCHSGSGSRGGIVRGDKPPGVSLAFARKKLLSPENGVFKEAKTENFDENSLATYVVFSAARAEEFDAEIINTDDNRRVPMGSLTYAVSKAFEKLDSGTTYRSLFARIQTIMNVIVQGQHPVLEGDGIDRELFGGRSVYQKPYIEIDNLNGKEIRIKAGLFSGLDSGAQIAVYPAGTVDPSKIKALATGKVNEANSYTAEVTLDKDPGLTEAVSGWVFITSPVYNTRPIKIRFVSNVARGAPLGFSESDIKLIKNSLKDLPLITFDDNAELVIAKGVDNDSVKVASNGFLFRAIKNITANPDNLKEALQNYAQVKYLKELLVKDPDIHIEIKLVPVINGKADTAQINSKIVNGAYEYNEGDKMVIWVKNTGKHPFYFNILDIQPDGKINAVLPQRSQKIYADDLKINGQSSFLFDKFVIYITPPAGLETLKIFASTDRIDLEDIATTKGTTPRGNLSVLEKLIKKSYDIAQRGAGDVENLSNVNGVAYDLLFWIKAKQ